MGEAINNHERAKSSEKNSFTSTEQQQEKLKSTIESGLIAKNKAKESIDEIRTSIDTEARRQPENRKTDSQELSDYDAETPTFVNKNMKKTAYKKELQRIQSNLKKPDRVFSKFIHNKNVEAASDIGAKTFARSSGILGGSIVALFGSSMYLWMSKNYGFSYNYFVFIILFILGFSLGIVVELVIKPFLKKH